MPDNNKTRILLHTDSQIRKFFFILPREDGSISYSSSLPKPEEIKFSELKIPNGGNYGKVRMNFRDGQDVDPDIFKFSYHPSLSHSSGTMRLKSSSGKYLFKYDVNRLEGLEDYKKILTIIPKNVSGYSAFKKKLSEYDMIFPIDLFQNKPFCVYVFICNKSFDINRLFQPDFEKCIIRTAINRSFLLVVMLFRRFSHPTEWSPYSVFIPFQDGVDYEI